MTTTRRELDHPVDDVFATIANPETYPHWLIGARDIRAIDPTWPAPGSSFHHRVGLVGPLKVADATTVLAVDEPRCLRLEVRARPLVRAEVTFEVTDAEGSPGRCVLTMEEHPIGPFRLVGPLLEPVTSWRNGRSLAQLADLLDTGRSHRAPG